MLGKNTKSHRSCWACGSGHRSAIDMAALQMVCFGDVKSLAGGTNAWTEAELLVVVEQAPGGRPRLEDWS